MIRRPPRSTRTCTPCPHTPLFRSTADTLAAMRESRRRGYLGTLVICNSPESSLVRESDLKLMTRAGPEIGVASTKAFTTQQIGRAHVCTPVTNAHLVCRLLLDKKNTNHDTSTRNTTAI